MIIDVRILKGARVALGLSQAELANKAGIGRATLVRMEIGADSRISSVIAVQRALESAGVVFTQATSRRGDGFYIKSNVLRDTSNYNHAKD